MTELGQRLGTVGAQFQDLPVISFESLSDGWQHFVVYGESVGAWRPWALVAFAVMLSAGGEYRSSCGSDRATARASVTASA
ncbi:hypothetical protein ACIRQH_26090 [Streptomyces sp. NPDC102279]|uniref:hypothetical protein n=1 Tax=Streptomyces sp. NPDC102279 TaxID=3366153 RepID=UPI0037F2F0A3